MTRAAFIHSDALEAHHYPEGNPFSTDRAGMAHRMARSMGLVSGMGRSVVPPVPATREEVERLHSPRYLDVLAEAEAGHLDAEGLHMGLGSPECPVFLGMNEYAMTACGATLTAARLLLDGEADIAFNPSGGYHHAGPDYASGFCYINDVALACLALADAGKRVAFLDVDVHHGDGVQNFFYDRSDILTLSIHESGEFLFPGTGGVSKIGDGEGRGYSVNVPLPPETYDDAYVRVFLEAALPILRGFDPDVIVYEVGMDCLAGDPLAHLNLTNNAYADVTEMALALGKPILATGGGGYNPENSARGWALVWSVLCGEAHHEPALGMGGVMLESSDWLGGLRDRVLAPEPQQRETVEAAVDAVIETLRRTVFPIHGLCDGGDPCR